jgi:hypothetical protein
MTENIKTVDSPNQLMVLDSILMEADYTEENKSKQ